MYVNPIPDIPQLESIPRSSLLPPASQQLPKNGMDYFPTSLLSHSLPSSRSLSPVLGTGPAGTTMPSSSTERFLLTAADQSDGTRDERLNSVIRAKYEAGLLKPFNYIKGYERLNTWMDNTWSNRSKHRTLKIISEFRPAFRVRFRVFLPVLA